MFDHQQNMNYGKPNNQGSQFRQFIIENKMNNMISSDNNSLPMNNSTNVANNNNNGNSLRPPIIKKLTSIVTSGAELHGSYRSSSAPPQESLEEQPNTPTNTNANELYIRSNPQYYDYYYSHKNLNPRLPPPILTTSWRKDETQPPSSPGAVGEEKKSKPRSVLDQIQQDFPRTPSPVFNLNTKDTPVMFTPSNGAQQPPQVLPQESTTSHHHYSGVKIQQPQPKKAGRGGYYESNNEMIGNNVRKAPYPQRGSNYHQNADLDQEEEQLQEQFQHMNINQQQQQQQWMGSADYPPMMFNGQQQMEYYQNYNKVIVMREGMYSNTPNNMRNQIPPQNAPAFYGVPQYYVQPYMVQPQGASHIPVEQQMVSNNVPYVNQFHQGPYPQSHHYPPQNIPKTGGLVNNANTSPTSGGNVNNQPVNNNSNSAPNSNGSKAGRGDRNSASHDNHSRKSKNQHQNTTSERSEQTQMSPLMDEFKNGRSGRKFELNDIVGHVVEFSRDQHGSRFIQQKLEKASNSEKELIFKEIQPHALSLMTDVFGNYVIQKFFEFGNSPQKKKLSKELQGNVLNLTLQTYGCRVIQKALEVIDNDDKDTVVSELKGNVMRCVQDQNGNHVIQKCIERVPPKIIQFIVDGFKGKVYEQAIHNYGCRVIQRILEHCTELQTAPILQEILDNILALVVDPYGNYVVQHVLDRGKPGFKSLIIAALSRKIQELSVNKFASNVIEKCFQQANKKERDNMITELIGDITSRDISETPLFAMMKDQFANYVIQKIIETCDASQRKTITEAVKPHQEKIKKLPYGKHILSTIEKVNEQQL